MSNAYQTLRRFVASNKLASIFIALGINAFIFAVIISFDNPKFALHIWNREIMHLGFGCILYFGIFFGLQELERNLKLKGGLKWYWFFFFPIVVVLGIALFQERGDWVKASGNLDAQLKSVVDICCWLIGSGYGAWVNYRICERSFIARRFYLARNIKPPKVAG